MRGSAHRRRGDAMSESGGARRAGQSPKPSPTLTLSRCVLPRTHTTCAASTAARSPLSASGSARRPDCCAGWVGCPRSERERETEREKGVRVLRVYPGPRRALPCVGEVARREGAPRDRGRETQKTQPASSSLPLLLLAQDPTPNTCVTVCGTSGEDACLDACARAVCGNMHQVRGGRESRGELRRSARERELSPAVPARAVMRKGCSTSSHALIPFLFSFRSPPGMTPA